MKVSIITVCRNVEETLEETVISVLSQTYPHIEYIIIDGVSTDNTDRIINKYADKLAYFVSEKDSGMYEAMNKGIKVANGDIIYFLNSGDKLFHSSIVANIIGNFNKSNIELLYGDIIEFDKNTGICNIKKHNKINKAYLYTNAICQQSIFYRKEVFEKYGYFDDRYKIVGDREWLFRAFIKEKIKAKYISIPFALFEKGGVSNNATYEKIHAEERKDFKKLYFNPHIVSFTAALPKSLKQSIIKVLGIY